MTKRCLFWIAVIFFCILGLALRLIYASQPIPELLKAGFPDEGFFYSGVSKHIALGHGSTFDGVHPTNGYHPLWVWVYAVIHLLFTNTVDAVHAALTLSSVLNIGTSLIIFSLAKHFTEKKWIRLLALGIGLFSPHLFFVTLNGMETALNLFLFSLLFLFTLKWKNALSVKRSAILGIISGLLFLARTDMAFVILAFVLYLGAPIWRKENFKKFFAAFAAAALAVTLPWFIWNYANFGTFMQASASAPTLIWRELYQAQAPGKGFFIDAVYFLKYSFWKFRQSTPGLATYFGFPGLSIFLLGFLIGNLKQESRSAFLRLLLPVLPLSIIFFIHGFIRWYNRDYYMMPWNVVTILLLVFALDQISKMEHKIYAKSLSTAVFAAVILWAGNTYRETYILAPRYQGNSVYGTYLATLWAKENLPKNAALSSIKHAGTVNFFQGGRAENLDSKENNTIISYLKEHRLYEYLKENKIEYIIDPEDKVTARALIFGIPDFSNRVKPIYSIDKTPEGKMLGTTISVFKIDFRE